ncbi:voltage-dependent anion channel domain-containing protein [Trichoderma breve]|uniref:Sulfite efflux pump SSU1 n=1 Tax=Trichoderma breve TaxID=2034170 RepID=A0A9W9E9J7_9HYPO|nr:voltage-dependent anion channel domain-containing protein [Trichoderma breve]KAJ4859881.1 voltage-dependent anion channel domain-containing protein [Trichoderma breve]
MDGTVKRTCAINGTKILPDSKNGTEDVTASLTTLLSPPDDVTVNPTVNAPQSEMDKMDISPPPLQKREKNIWIVVRAFTPAWFTMNMGTGIVSILLHNLPYNGAWLYWISVIFFVLNLTLFILFTVISALRYLIYPGLFMTMIRHPAVPLLSGAFPIALSTIVEMIVLVCVPAWGPWTVTLAWTLWWIDAAISIIICYWIPFVIMHTHDIKLATLSATWLLPIAAPIVASAIGAVVAEVLENEQHALWTLITSYFLWGTAMPLSLTCLVIFYQRLSMHNLPPPEAIVSMFLPVAPLGQGGYAIMQLGKVAAEVFPKTGTLSKMGTHSGEILYVIGWIVGFIMWANGLAWIFFALASISRRKFPFNIGWWGFTFPLGVWAGATIGIGQEMPSRFFNVLGTIASVVVTLLWIMVAIGTIRKIVDGKIFLAPDFEQWKKKKIQATEAA